MKALQKICYMHRCGLRILTSPDVLEAKPLSTVIFAPDVVNYLYKNFEPGVNPALGNSFFRYVQLALCGLAKDNYLLLTKRVGEFQVTPLGRNTGYEAVLLAQKANPEDRLYDVIPRPSPNCVPPPARKIHSAFVGSLGK